MKAGAENGPQVTRVRFPHAIPLGLLLLLMTQSFSVAYMLVVLRARRAEMVHQEVLYVIH